MSARPTDIELLEAWRSGDTEAGSALFERHFDCLARFFANKIPTGLDDLVQQTFLGAVEARDRFRGEAQFKTFLLRIAHNTLCKHYRRQRVRGEEPDFSVTAVQDLGPSPSVVAAKRAEQRILLEALRRIPLDLQVVLELAYWERSSATQIAEILELPPGTIKTRIRRAKQLLREAIEALSGSAAELQSTVDGLDRWADSLRRMVATPQPSA